MSGAVENESDEDEVKVEVEIESRAVNGLMKSGALTGASDAGVGKRDRACLVGTEYEASRYANDMASGSEESNWCTESNEKCPFFSAIQNVIKSLLSSAGSSASKNPAEY